MPPNSNNSLDFVTQIDSAVCQKFCLKLQQIAGRMCLRNLQRKYIFHLLQLLRMMKGVLV